MLSMNKVIIPSQSNLNDSRSFNNAMKEFVDNEDDLQKLKIPPKLALSKKIRESLNQSASSSQQGSVRNSRKSIFLPIPTVVRNENIIMGTKTYKSFIKSPSNGKNSLLEPGIAGNKKSMLKRGDTMFTKFSEKKQDDLKNKKKGIGGKMFINELWGKKHYQEIINSTLLKEQDDEYRKLHFQTTEEKAETSEGYIYAKYVLNNDITDKLIDKYQRQQPILKEDLAIYTDSALENPLLYSEETPKSRGSILKHSFSINRFLTPSPKNQGRVSPIRLGSINHPKENLINDEYVQSYYPIILNQNQLNQNKSSFSTSGKQSPFSPMRRIIKTINSTNQILHEDLSLPPFVHKTLDNEQFDTIETKKIKLPENERQKSRVSIKLISRPQLNSIKSPTNKSLGEFKSPKNMMMNRRNSKSFKDLEHKLLRNELSINLNTKNSILSIPDTISPTNQMMMSLHNIIDKCNAAQQTKANIKTYDRVDSPTKQLEIGRKSKLQKSREREKKDSFINYYHNVVEERNKKNEQLGKIF